MPHRHGRRCRRVVAALWAAFLCLVDSAAAVVGDGECGHRDTVVAELEKERRQLPMHGSVTHDGTAFLTLADELEGGWTILIIEGQVACQLEHGAGWHDLRIWRPIEIDPEGPDGGE